MPRDFDVFSTCPGRMRGVAFNWKFVTESTGIRKVSDAPIEFEWRVEGLSCVGVESCLIPDGNKSDSILLEPISPKNDLSPLDFCLWICGRFGAVGCDTADFGVDVDTETGS